MARRLNPNLSMYRPCALWAMDSTSGCDEVLATRITRSSSDFDLASLPCLNSQSMYMLHADTYQYRLVCCLSIGK